MDFLACPCLASGREGDGWGGCLLGRAASLLQFFSLFHPSLKKEKENRVGQK